MNSYLIDLFAGTLVVTPAYFRLLYYVVCACCYTSRCVMYTMLCIFRCLPGPFSGWVVSVSGLAIASECVERAVREYPAGLWRGRTGDPGVLVAAQLGQY